MEDISKAGIETYVAAAPIPKKGLPDLLMGLLLDALKLFYVIILSIPILLRMLQETVTGRSQKIIEGQLALVTGGGNGLGKAIAIELAKRKVNVAVADLDVSAAERVAAECRTFGVKAKHFKANVSVFADLKQLSRDIEDELGPVDILINNAGIMPTTSFSEGKPEDIQTILDVNITSHIWSARVFLPSMIRRGKGHIVAISSMAGITPLGRAATYTASKFAVRGFMGALREDLRLDGLQDKIHTTTVFPYFILTRKDMIDLVSQSNLFDKSPPLLPEDVAQSVVRAIVRNDVHVELPKSMSVITAIVRSLPYEIQDLFKSALMTGIPKIQQ